MAEPRYPIPPAQRVAPKTLAPPFNFQVGAVAGQRAKGAQFAVCVQWG